VASDSFDRGRAVVPEQRTTELPEIETGTGWPDEAEEADRRTSTDLDERPRRFGRPTGCMFFLVGLGALLLVIMLGLKVTGLLPSFHNPFAQQKTDRSGPTLLLSIQDMARFEAASGNFQEVIDVQKDRSHIPDIIFNERTLFICVGSVDAYVDFSHIGQGDITDSADHKTVTVKLPAVQMEKPNIDHGKSYVYAVQQGLVNKLGDLFGGNPNKEQELYLLGEQRIAQAARDSGLADRAAQNTRQMLTGMLKSLGYTSITINIPAP
jgi:hypothetical protein